MYSAGLEFQEQERKSLIESGKAADRMRRIVSPRGPRVHVDFALPVLPGVLLVTNGYTIGPLWGRGQVTFFLYYGFGVCRLFEFMTWIS